VIGNGAIPEEVFTPRKPPQREMFTRHNEPDVLGNPGLQDSLRDALREPGGQIILYGDTGVGKSTLLQYAAEDEAMPILSIECISRRSFDDHVDTAIREITSEREIEIVQAGSSEVGGEAGISKVITIKGHIKNQKGQDVRIEILERAPLLALAETMHSATYACLPSTTSRTSAAGAQSFRAGVRGPVRPF
jgi:replication-associated recombination protein RarA